MPKIKNYFINKNRVVEYSFSNFFIFKSSALSLFISGLKFEKQKEKIFNNKKI